MTTQGSALSEAAEKITDDLYQEAQMSEYYGQLALQGKHESSLLKTVLMMAVDEDNREAFVAELRDHDFTNALEVVDKAKGKKRSGEHLEEVWADQYENGGHTGDSYAGYGYFPLNTGHYLKFHYTM